MAVTIPSKTLAAKDSIHLKTPEIIFLKDLGIQYLYKMLVPECGGVDLL